MKKIKLLTLGLLTLIGIGSFCNAGEMTYNGSFDGSRNGYQYFFLIPIPYSNYSTHNYDINCSISNYDASVSTNNISFVSYYDDGNLNSQSCNLSASNLHNNGVLSCTYSSNRKYFVVGLRTIDTFQGSFDWTCNISGTNIIEKGGTCDYSDYVPVSDYNTCLSDLNTATGNYLSCQSSISGYENSLNNCSSNLNSCNTSLSSCLSANCPNNTGNISRSALFINNIQHIGAPVIRMTIPEELSWDYAYTDSGNNMEIDIEGYNVDYDKINNIVDIQSYKPTDEDFSNIIGLLADYMPILIIFVGLIFIYKFLTKSFKSKL